MAKSIPTFLLLGIALAATSQAADYSWQAGPGDWSIASNWGGALPAYGNNAYIVNGGTTSVTSSGPICGNLTLGTTAGAGALQLLNGSIGANGSDYVGSSGAGTFIQSGGTNYCYSLSLGTNLGGSGEYDLVGGQLSADSDEIGGYGNGAFVQTGGTNSPQSDVYVGSQGSGSYSLGGSGVFTSSDVLQIAFYHGGSGTFSLSGSARLSARGELIGVNGPGVFTQSGGTNTCQSINFGFGGGTLNLDGGLLTVTSSVTINLRPVFNFSGGTLQAGGSFSTFLPINLGTSGGGGTIDSGRFVLTFSGSLSGAGGLTKIGSGALSLTGTDTYTGPTTIEQGLLIVNGHGPFASPVTVESGGSLSGTGSLTSVVVDAGGQLAPGGTIGTLELSGSLTLQSGAALDFELGAPATSDLILMPSGALTLSGQQFADFHFMALAGFGPGDYTLIDADSIDGSLGGSLTGAVDGLPATLAVQGNDVVLHVVPEPSPLALLASGSVGLLGFHQLRRMRIFTRKDVCE